MLTTKKLIPFFMLPVLAIGCASTPEDEEISGGEDALTLTKETRAELGAAVGAIVINGKRLCTAALVKAEAGAKVTVNGKEFSAEGRQVVFGGACVGQLAIAQKEFLGAAVFVGQKNGVTVKTPILSFDFESKASLGLAVGILSEKSDDEPIEILGLTARANISAATASVLSVDEDGVLIGKGFEIGGGFDVSLKTECTHFKAGARAKVGLGGSLELSDGAAIVRVNGKLKFAAYIDVKVDGQCIVAKTIDGLNRVGEHLNSLGTGDVVSMQYRNGSGKTTMSVYLDKPAKVLRLNSQGFIRAKSEGAECTKIQVIIGGPCELMPEGGFARGWHNVEVNLGLDLLPNRPEGQLVVFSTADQLFTPPQDPNASPGG